MNLTYILQSLDPNIEPVKETSDIGPSMLLHDRIAMIYQQAMRKNLYVTFSPSLSTQLSAFRNSMGIDPGWVEVQKVLLDCIKDCQHKWPQTKRWMVPQGQHPRMETFKDNIDALTKTISNITKVGLHEEARNKETTEQIEKEIATGTIVAENISFVDLHANPEENVAHIAMSVDMAKDLLNYLSNMNHMSYVANAIVDRNKFTVEEITEKVQQGIDQAQGAIELSDYPEILNDENVVYCPKATPVIKDENYDVRSYNVSIDLEEMQDEALLGQANENEDYRGSILRRIIKKVKEAKGEDGIIIHYVYLYGKKFCPVSLKMNVKTIVWLLERRSDEENGFTYH